MRSPDGPPNSLLLGVEPETASRRPNDAFDPIRTLPLVTNVDVTGVLPLAPLFVRPLSNESDSPLNPYSRNPIYGKSERHARIT